MAAWCLFQSNNSWVLGKRGSTLPFYRQGLVVKQSFVFGRFQRPNLMISVDMDLRQRHVKIR